MAPKSSTADPPEQCHNLSDFPDLVLGRILSFLPSDEAGRTAVLSTRLRHVFGSVDAISFEQPDTTRSSYITTQDEDYFYEASERTSLNAYFLQRVAAAFLCRRRAAGCLDTPLRRLHISMHSRYDDWDSLMIDQWLAYALRLTDSEFHLELRLCGASTCRHRITGNGVSHEDVVEPKVDDDEPDEDEEDEQDTVTHGTNGNGNGQAHNAYMDHDGPECLGMGSGFYHVPRRVFSCATLRSLCLQMFSLDEAVAINLPLVQTLHLSKTFEPTTAICRLISGCPRLVDLTLEECWAVKEISILDKRLRRFALLCCHRLRVTVDATELEAFQYRGALPEAAGCLSLLGSHKIISCNIELCGKEPCRKKELFGLRRFLMRFVDSQRLNLSTARLGCRIESNFVRGLPSFSSLRHLELKGYLLDNAIVNAVAKILEQTPNLEVLSLFILPKTVGEIGGHELEDDRHVVPDIPDVSPVCLQCRVRQISLVHYQGNMAQRMVAKWLLQNALVLNKLCVAFPKGPFWLQDQLAREIQGWPVNQSALLLII